MLHSKYSHKDTSEDRKTSSVFENLMLLPDNVFWNILKTSCFYNERMMSNSGRLLDYEFWCHWDSRHMYNTYYVEPDLFLRFEQFDVIIEAKLSDTCGQYKEQWVRELNAYNNEHGEEERTVIFIAVGGNVSVNVEEVKVRGVKHSIFKCSWASILTSINKYRNELLRISFPDFNVSSTLRLLDNIILAFNINGVSNIEWFDTMATEKLLINKSSIDELKKYFTI